MNSVITYQPVISYQTEPSPVDIYKHKCLCEKCSTYLCNNHTKYADPEKHYCCVNCNEWLNTLKTRDDLSSNGDTLCCTVVCCPIKFPLLFTFGLPCTMYNILRNKCTGTKDKNYLC
jgi:hypothetical protein